MIKKRALSYVLFLTLFALVIMGILFIVPPPGELPHSVSHPNAPPVEYPYMFAEGELPGVTWADDIHPIFMRNGCGTCHTRGEEDTVEGLTEFALGLIEPKAPSNPYYSFHELIYAEGPPQIQKGERLRDGQCCWPRGFAPKEQRRIWLGHAERSVVMHKLDRDYYDWNKPPRFLEEGLRLLWGPPMPWYAVSKGHSHNESEDTGQKKEHGGTHDEKIDDHENGKDEHGYEPRSFFMRTLFHLSLWLGFNRDKLYTLPPKIPKKDNALLRYWISHAVQIIDDGTQIKVRVVDRQDRPLKDSIVHLIGNFNSPEKAKVTDVIDIKTGVQGEAVLPLTKWSVITSFFFVSAEKNGKTSEYKFLRVVPGRVNKIEITI